MRSSLRPHARGTVRLSAAIMSPQRLEHQEPQEPQEPLPRQQQAASNSPSPAASSGRAPSQRRASRSSSVRTAVATVQCTNNGAELLIARLRVLEARAQHGQLRLLLVQSPSSLRLHVTENSTITFSRSHTPMRHPGTNGVTPCRGLAHNLPRMRSCAAAIGELLFPASGAVSRRNASPGHCLSPQPLHNVPWAPLFGRFNPSASRAKYPSLSGQQCRWLRRLAALATFLETLRASNALGLGKLSYPQPCPSFGFRPRWWST